MIQLRAILETASTIKELRAIAAPGLTICIFWLAGGSLAFAHKASDPIARVPRQHAVQPDVVLPESLSLNRAPAGYSVGNFAIAASISENGLKIARSLINPPVLGRFLESFGEGELTLTAGGQSDFEAFNRYSVFPENFAQLFSKTTNVEARVATFAPIDVARKDAPSFDGFIPALIVQVRLINHSKRSQSVSLSYTFSPEDNGNVSHTNRPDAPVNIVAQRPYTKGIASVYLMYIPNERTADTNASTEDGEGHRLNRHATIAVDSGHSRSVSFVIGVYDPRGYTSRQFSSRTKMQAYLLKGLDSMESSSTPVARGGALATRHANFISALPRTGDPELDVYSRWYLSAAVLLTKGIRSGEVLTMGYRELNQRDSYWSSGAHLIFWPDLELKMLRESMSFQLPNGRIPLTILPTIIRENNIDGNEYFVLRIARYYRWYRDTALLTEALPSIKRAIGHLIDLDTEQVGIPKQMDFWADWKDVEGTQGRSYAPHFALLWLATLKEATFLALEAGDSNYASRLSALYDKAYERVNRDVPDGGLWDHTRYVDLWEDGRKTPYTLEDQTTAAIFDVIPKSRLSSIYATLNATNESTYGVRETYPYIPEFKQRYPVAENHNGGIWPFLNCVDAWGRFKNGYAHDAERIIKKTGYNGLVRDNGFSPAEFLNGDNGKIAGYKIQGWDAACFSAIYFGAFGLDRVSNNEFAVRLNFTQERNFSTSLLLPEGPLTLSRIDGRVSVAKSFGGPSQIRVVPQ